MSEINDQLKQEAERKYPELFQQCNGGHHEMYGICDVNFYERQAYIAGTLSRSGGVWVKAINQKPPDNKWPYEIVFRNITTKRVLDILSYWTEEKWELNDADQNGTPVGTLIPISEIEWLNESPAADKGDAIDGWISVEDRLPTVDDGNKNGYVMTYLRNDRQWGWPTKIGFNKCDRVSKRTHTHWRPLPQPPQSK